MTRFTLNGDVARMADETLMRLDEEPPIRRGQPAAFIVAVFLAMVALAFLAIAHHAYGLMHDHNAERITSNE